MLTQCHVDVGALSQNMTSLRRQLKPGVLLAPCVKGNGYGHGLVVAALAFLVIESLFADRLLRRGRPKQENPANPEPQSA